MFIKTKGIVIKKFELPNRKKLVLIFTRESGVVSSFIFKSNKDNNLNILNILICADFVFKNKTIRSENENHKIESVFNIENFENIANDINKYNFTLEILGHIYKLLPSLAISKSIFDLVYKVIELINSNYDLDFLKAYFYSNYLLIEGKLEKDTKFNSEEIRIIEFLTNPKINLLNKFKLENKSILVKLKDEFVNKNY